MDISAASPFEERYGLGEIFKEIFLKYTARYREEKKEVEKKLAESAYDASNLEKFVEDSLEIACNIHIMWNTGNYKVRETLQYLMFPEGILYDRQINGLRTPMVNPVFQAIACLSDAIQSSKNKKADASVGLSNLVGKTIKNSNQFWKDLKNISECSAIIRKHIKKTEFVEGKKASKVKPM